MKVVVYGVTKEFVSGQGTIRALGGINLEVRDREFFGIIGPTGCAQALVAPGVQGVDGAHRSAPHGCPCRGARARGT